MAWGKPTEPWFATGVAMAIAGLGALGIQYQTTETAPSPEPFWGWLAYTGAILIFFGAFLALANAGIPLKASTEVVRARLPKRKVAPSPRPEAAPVPKTIVAKFPWFDGDQLVLPLHLGDQRVQQVPKGPLHAEIRTAIGDVVARSKQIGQAYRDAGWLSYARYPRDFAGAPPLQVGSVYEVVWIIRIPVYNKTNQMIPHAPFFFGDEQPWHFKDTEVDARRFKIAAANSVWIEGG